jgi:hypothetical protein
MGMAFGRDIISRMLPLHGPGEKIPSLSLIFTMSGEGMY